MPPVNNVIFGPYVFSSGYNPSHIKGPNKDSYIVEHSVPGSEGGIVEYIGSRQPAYQIRGFLTPNNDVFNGTAGAMLSGTGYVAPNTDDALTFLTGLRGSGANLLRIESTATNYSGYAVLYENGFFYIEKMTFGVEPGKAYPYYPYSIELRGASTKTYGSSSGPNNFGPGMSGYIFAWRLISGLPLGEPVIALGFYVQSVASGSLKLAVYNQFGGALQVQTASQAAHSGWNYFPVRPSFTTSSGVTYMLAIKGNIVNSSGFNGVANDLSTFSGTMRIMSGEAYSADFPTSLTFLTGMSGQNPRTVMVTQ